MARSAFICYRRTDEAWALSIYGELTARGFDVFIDYLGLGNGPFEQEIISNIEARTHFIVLLTPTALERTVLAEDWLRKEIEHAIKTKRNIVPVLLEGFRFDALDATFELPEVLKSLPTYNAVNVPQGFFHAAVDRLVTKFLGDQPERISQPLTAEAAESARLQQVAASKAVLALSASGDGIAVMPSDSASATAERITRIANRRLMSIGLAISALGISASWLYPFLSRTEKTPDVGTPLPRHPSNYAEVSIDALSQHELRFSILQNGKPQSWSLQLQPAVASLMEQHFSFQRDVGNIRALSSLLLPPTLRAILRDLGDVPFRINVDGVTANFPWEAVIGTLTDKARAVSVVRSILGVSVPGERTQAGKNALVIASPQVDHNLYPPLPGSEHEGTQVASILTKAGYDATVSLKEQATQVLQHVVLKDYRIALVTGHGESDVQQIGGRSSTGVVLSNGSMLTAQEFEQMPIAPELIFLNCAKLGRFTGSTSSAASTDQFLVARLLRFGVRTVIASNWSMDDVDAVNFSVSFFTALIANGQTVEQAALTARADAIMKNPSGIGWAIYQVYGAADYKL